MSPAMPTLHAGTIYPLVLIDARSPTNTMATASAAISANRSPCAQRPRKHEGPAPRAWASMACGVLSSLLYVGWHEFAALQWEGYSRVSNAISELHLTGAPSRWLLEPWLVLVADPRGDLGAVARAGHRRSIPVRLNSSGAPWGCRAALAESFLRVCERKVCRPMEPPYPCLG